jgi:hypothetical protein
MVVVLLNPDHRWQDENCRFGGPNWILGIGVIAEAQRVDEDGLALSGSRVANLYNQLIVTTPGC